MFNVCSHCGVYRADKIIDPDGPYAICPECGHKHPFLRLPLLIVSGASGTGKTTICTALTGSVRDAVLLDSDILWRPEFNQPENHYRDFFETWLRVSKNINQSGRPVVLFGAGMGVPENVEPCVERRYFSTIHYLALTCDEHTLVNRLQARPEWRGSSDPAFIEAQVQFNRWFQETPHPLLTLLDTTSTLIDQTAAHVAAWIQSKLS